MERALGDGCLGGHPPTFVPAAHANSGWRLRERCWNTKWLESTGESQLAQPAARREKCEPVGQGYSHWPASYYQDRQLHCWRSSQGRLSLQDSQPDFLVSLTAGDEKKYRTLSGIFLAAYRFSAINGFHDRRRGGPSHFQPAHSLRTATSHFCYEKASPNLARRMH